MWKSTACSAFPRAKNQLAGKLSGGQKRLLALSFAWQAQVALLGRANGGHGYVDPSAFWEIVHDLKEKGVTIFISHYIEEVEHTAERILVLHQGRLLRDTTPFAMRSEEQEKK